MSMEGPSGGVGSLANYESMNQVGEGTYGYVYKARDKRDGSTVALKRLIIHKDHGGFPLCAVREVKFLKQLSHPNIVKLLDIACSKGCEHLDGALRAGDKGQQALKAAEKAKANQALAARGNKDGGDSEAREREKQQEQLAEQEKLDNAVSSLLLQRCGNLYLVFEYSEHDLGGMIDAKYKFNTREIKCIMKQLFEVLDFLQERHILHRDIKCSNVLISPRHVVKLADFGLARSTLSPDGREGKKRLTNNVVTMWYKSPELLLGMPRYSYAVDVWSTGCILAELELGRPLMPGKTEAEQLDLICRTVGTPSEQTWPGVSALPYYDAFLRHAQQTYTSSLKNSTGSAGTSLSDAAMSLLDRVLVADPSMRASAKVALSSKYFMIAPQAPRDPRELPPLSIPEGVSMHEFETKQKKKEDAAAKANPPVPQINPGSGMMPRSAGIGMPMPPAYGVPPMIPPYGGYGQALPGREPGQAQTHLGVASYGGAGLARGMAGYQQQQQQQQQKQQSTPSSANRNRNGSNGNGSGKRRGGPGGGKSKRNRP